MGLVALILKYAVLVGVLVYVVAVLRAMILTMPCADAGRPRKSSSPPARTPVRRPRPRQHPATRASRAAAPEPVPPEPSEPEPTPEPEPPREVEPTEVFAAEPEPLPPAEVPTAAMFAARSDPEAEALPVPEPPPTTATSVPLPVEVKDSFRDGPVLRVEDPGESHLVAGALVFLGHGVHVGRAPENDLVIDSTTISRQHAYIGPRGEAWLLVDKGSANGTFVNGRRVTGPQELANGDILTLGNVSFVLDLRGGGPAG